MTLITTPFEALQAGREARKLDLAATEMPSLSDQLKQHYIDGWKLQNLIELYSDHQTRFLAKGFEFFDLGPDEKPTHRTDSWQSVAAVVERLNLKPDCVVDIALEQLKPVAIESKRKLNQ